MTTKELTRRQMRWAEKLFEYNFKIMYQSGAKNVKADALTRKSDDKPTGLTDERLTYQHQVLLTPERLQICVTEPESDAFIHDRILFANQKDDDCIALRTAKDEDRTTYKGVRLRRCSVKEEILYCQDRL